MIWAVRSQILKQLDLNLTFLRVFVHKVETRILCIFRACRLGNGFKLAIFASFLHINPDVSKTRFERNLATILKTKMCLKNVMCPIARYLPIAHWQRA